MTRPTVLLALATLAALLAIACGDVRPLAGESGQCVSCHGDAATASLLRGAHSAHLAPDGVAGAISCGDCHPVPSSIGADGHVNGHADVVFGERAGGEAARWDAENGTCAVYCHGTTLGGGPVASPDWRVGDVHLTCSSCHGAPPPAPHPESTSCASCHPASVADDGTIVAEGGHVNGRVDVGSVEETCGSCHAIPPPSPHTSSTSCASCHTGYTSTTVNVATHQNGQVDVTSLACGTCHAIPPSSGHHSTHVDRGISCGSCHPGASTTYGGTGHMDGDVDVAAPGWDPSSVSCANACHGGENERWY